MEHQTQTLDLHLTKNALLDKGEGYVQFPSGLVITDTSKQRNGTQYDIESMDLSEYKGTLTADHTMSISEVIGKVDGIRKDAGRVMVSGIQFAVKESSLARFAYNMLVEGFLSNFSIETMGPMPDEEGIYYNSKLVGLSLVVLGNNKSATVNQLVVNSIKESKELGLETNKLETFLESLEGGDNMKKQTVTNSRKFAVTVTYKNDAGETVTKELDPKDTVEVSEDQVENVEAQIDEAEKPVETKDDNASSVVTAINKLAESVNNRLDKIEQSNTAKEPEFKKNNGVTVVKNELAGKGYMERHADQINAFIKNDRNTLEDINKFHLEQLQEKNVVKNTMTITDMGNFVISPELLSDIEGHRSNFRPLLDRLPIRETLSMQMSWLNRNGDIDMEEVEYCDDGADGNLKPISEYSATIGTSNLHELAAVTPICNAATRFLAVDLLADVAEGYRTDYDRKLAQLFVARMQQAVDSTDNKVTYTNDSGVIALGSLFDVAAEVEEQVEGNGVYIFNYATYNELKKQVLAAGSNGPLSDILLTGDVRTMNGQPFIVVPNELLPTLGVAGTKSFTVEGSTVTINQAIFYVDPTTYAGRTSGGLQYDLSTDAAYESGGNVYSAFQRNEVVLRGSFNRGGAIKDSSKVASVAGGAAS